MTLLILSFLVSSTLPAEASPSWTPVELARRVEQVFEHEGKPLDGKWRLELKPLDGDEWLVLLRSVSPEAQPLSRVIRELPDDTEAAVAALVLVVNVQLQAHEAPRPAPPPQAPAADPPLPEDGPEHVWHRAARLPEMNQMLESSISFRWTALTVGLHVFYAAYGPLLLVGGVPWYVSGAMSLAASSTVLTGAVLALVLPLESPHVAELPVAAGFLGIGMGLAFSSWSPGPVIFEGRRIFEGGFRLPLLISGLSLAATGVLVPATRWGRPACTDAQQRQVLRALGSAKPSERTEQARKVEQCIAAAGERRALDWVPQLVLVGGFLASAGSAALVGTPFELVLLTGLTHAASYLLLVQLHLDSMVGERFSNIIDRHQVAPLVGYAPDERSTVFAIGGRW